MDADTGYLEAKRIRDLLVESNPESRSFFGRLSGIAVSCEMCYNTFSRLSLKNLVMLSKQACHSSDVADNVCRVSGMELFGLTRRSCCTSGKQHRLWCIIQTMRCMFE